MGTKIGCWTDTCARGTGQGGTSLLERNMRANRSGGRRTTSRRETSRTESEQEQEREREVREDGTTTRRIRGEEGRRRRRTPRRRRRRRPRHPPPPRTRPTRGRGGGCAGEDEAQAIASAVRRVDAEGGQSQGGPRASGARAAHVNYLAGGEAGVKRVEDGSGVFSGQQG